MTATIKAGRYELLEEVGRGAMGVVYRANDPVIGRTVAVKTLRVTEHSSGLSQEELLRRFHTEARAAGLLNHPNIVSVYDAGKEDDFLYITMELVEGKSLQDSIGDRRAFPLTRILRLMQQACSALDFAHQHNVVHRDIKPANLILTPDDTLKISDFGTAKILQFQSAQTGQIVGTPSYMSPEQIKGQPVDGRSDIFSLGAVLYELLTGRKPFPGDSITAVIYKIVSEEPPPPRELDASIHQGLSAIVLRALAKSPGARFQSCCQFFDALQNYREYEAPPPQLSKRNEKPVPQYDEGSTLSDSDPSWAEPVPEKKTSTVWLALFLLAVIGVAGYKVWPPVHELWLRTDPVPVLARHFRSPPVRQAVTSPQVTPAEAASSPSPDSTSVVPVVPAPGDVPPVLSETAQKKSDSTGQTPSAARTAATTITNVASRQEPAKPAISQAASEWKQHVLGVLEQSGLGDKVRVTALGSTLTLSGTLDPRAHGSLLGLLRESPTNIHIVDHIEESTTTSAP